jgi:nucleoside-diphosphate-sugar epimerase
MDATKISKELGWKPTVSIVEGIDKVISFFKKAETNS